jgi:hypothetical protein
MSRESNARHNRTRRQQRRARVWSERYGTPNPIYWPCPACLANPLQECRTRDPLPHNFHGARIREAIYGTGRAAAMMRANLDRLDRRAPRHVDRDEPREPLSAERAARLAAERRAARASRNAAEASS